MAPPAEQAMEFTDAELERRRRKSFEHLLRIFASGHPESSVTPLPGGVLSCRVPVSPYRSLLNSVVFDGDVQAVVDLLPQLHDHYVSAGVRAWTIWLHDPDQHEAARREFGAAGHKFDADPRAMGAAIDEIKLQSGELPEGFEFGETSWPEIAAINERAYGMRNGDFVNAVGQVPDDPANLLVAVREPGGETVAVGTFLRDGDNAEVCWIATLPDFRGRGLAARVMQRGLEESRSAGCTTTTLEATKLGEPVYAALGYRSFKPVEMWERRLPS